MAGSSLTPTDAEAMWGLLPHAVCVVDAGDRILWTNEAWAATLGGPSPAPGASFLASVCAEDPTPLVDALARCRSGEAMEPVPMRAPRGGAVPTWLAWRLAASSEGRVVACGEGVDVERRQGDEAAGLRLLEDDAEQCAALGSWRLDLADETLSWSPEMYRIFGVDPSAATDLAEATRSAVHPDDREMLEELNRAVMADGVPRSADYRILLPDGTVRWAHGQGRPVLDGSGHTVAFVGFVQDITERVLAEERLRESEERYRSIIDETQDAHFRTGLDGRLVFVNGAAAQMFGYDSPESMAGVLADTLYADPAKRESVLGDLRRDGVVRDWVGRARRIDGSRFWVSLNMQVVRDKDGRLAGTQGSARDITDRMHVEQALRDSELKFRTIADFAYDWEIWTGPSGAFLYMSPSCLRCTGYSRAEFLADPGLFERIVHPDDRGRVAGHLGIEGHCAPVPVVFRIVTKTGDIRWIEHVCEPVSDADGRDAGRRSSNRDITERVQAEAKVAASLSLLQATLESTADGILAVDSQGRVTQYNQRFAEMWGLHAPELNGFDDGALIGFISRQLADPAAFLEQVAYLETRQDEESFDTLTLADGRVFERYTRPQVIGDTISGRVWSFRDTTKHALAEQALRESEQDLREAQAIARIGSYVFDIANDVWTSSETMDCIFGIDAPYRRDLEGWLALVHEDDREMMARYVAEHVIAQRLPFDKKYRVTRADDGETVWVHGHGRLEEDAAGVPTRLIGAIQDITAQREGEEILRLTNQSLERMVYEVAQAMGRVVEIRDPYTQGHQQRTATLVKAIAIEMGLPASDVTAVEMAAVVHDVGKLSVPAEILSRPSKLTDTEFSLIMEHPRNGYEILKDIPFPWPVAEIVLQHHERIDGSGYPGHLSGADTMPLARLLAVADVVEAMATHRPYRPALGLDAAVAELRSAPERYDGEAVAACLRLYERGEIDL